MSAIASYAHRAAPTSATLGHVSCCCRGMPPAHSNLRPPFRACLLALLLVLMLSGGALAGAAGAAGADTGDVDDAPETLAVDTADTTDVDIDEGVSRLRAGTRSDRVSLAAEVTACETGPDAEDRAVQFTGSMPAIRGAVRMAMRFDLYERRAGDEDFVRRTVPTFGRWERSDKDVSGFVYDKRVEELDEAADYRTVVQFRWYDARGKVVRSSERTSYICRQADPADAGR